MFALAVVGLALAGLLVVLALASALTARRSAAGIVTSRLGRFLRVASGSLRMLGRLLRRKVARRLVSAKRRAALDARYQEESARLAAETMGNMKGVFMKLGQIVSFMDESMPPPVREQLRRLQNQAPPMSYEVVVRVIESELGSAPERLFAEFDREPLAAASIGQVHRAMLRDGTEVAVKIQYPGVDEAIEADLGNIHMVLATIGALTPTLDAGPLAEELRARIREELDYRLEARHQEDFRALFAEDESIHVPRVFPELSARRVLCTELVRGKGFYEFAAEAEPEARRRAVLAIRRFVFDSIWYHQVFNGDPHPGNYLFDDSGRVTFLDFGCVKHFDPTFIEDFKALNRSYLLGDRQAYWDKARSMGFLLAGQEHKADPDWLWNFTAYFYQPVLSDAPFAIDDAYCSRAIGQMFGDNMRKVNMPSEYLMLNRITFGFNSIMAKLGACENWRRLSWPYYFGAPHDEEAAAG